MPRWKKNATEFTVSVAYGEHDFKINVPKPIIEFLGKPDKITFKIESKKVIVKT